MNCNYRFKVDKLIRDKFSEIMRSKGIVISDRMMDKEEHIERLENKLVEEVQEVLDAKNRSEKKEELADVLEVIHSLCLVYDLPYESVEEARIKKQNEKGSFQKGIYCDFIEMNEDKEDINYYLTQPDRYPQIKAD